MRKILSTLIALIAVFATSRAEITGVIVADSLRYFVIDDEYLEFTYPNDWLMYNGTNLEEIDSLATARPQGGSYDGNIRIPETVFIEKFNRDFSVKSIGRNSLYHCHNVDSIFLPATIEYFAGFGPCYEVKYMDLSRIKTDTIKAILSARIEINLPMSTKVLSGEARSKKVIIPESIEEFGRNSMRSLTEEIVCHAKNPFLIKLHETSLYSVNKAKCILRVPAESVEAYKTAPVWCEFVNILPIEEDVAIIGPEADASKCEVFTSTGVKVYSGPQTEIPHLPSGLYIVNGKKLLK